MHDLKDRLQLLETKEEQHREMHDKALDMIEYLTGPQETMEQMILRRCQELQEQKRNPIYQPIMDRMSAMQTASITLSNKKQSYERLKSGVKMSTVNLRSREEIYGDDDFGFQIPMAIKDQKYDF